ncbi:MAG: hypothetical protein AAF411_27125 [Myxococcota bacterium]
MPSQAEEVLDAFFGERLIALIRNRQRSAAPECTGLFARADS